MRWVLVALATVSLGLGLVVAGRPAEPAFAATSAEVIVTATGFICDAPTSFTVTRISDTEVQLDWTKGEAAENTMVRAKYGEYPESETDGYEVYYGDGTTATDTTMDLDETGGKLYYRAWSETGDVYSDDYAEGWTQGVGVTLIGIVILTLGLLGLSIHYRNRALMMLAGSAGLALAIYGFTSMSSSGGDAFWVIGIIGAVLTMVVVFMAGMSLRGIKGEEEPEDERFAREMREESIARAQAREERRRYR